MNTKSPIDYHDTREALITMLANRGHTHVVTLTYNDPTVTPGAKIWADLRRLHREVDEQLLGKRFYKKPLYNRTEFALFYECGTYKHPHLHGGWRVPERYIDRFEKMFNEYGLWETLIAPKGSHKIEPMIIGNEEWWWRYATKYITNDFPFYFSLDFSANF